VFSLLNTPQNTVPFGEMGLVSMKYFLARRARTDQRQVKDVGACGGQPGSSAREGRSLHVDRHVDVEHTHWGAA
jgi:hypothetical protein